MDINNICPNCMSQLNEEDEFCSNCGYKKGSEDNTSTHALKPYTILQGKYLVGNVIGEGGFGITYIGLDLNLEIRIAIKEFYPNGFVTRESANTTFVTSYTSADKDQYEKWKERFVREARSLAKFSNLPGIVQVRDFFQENNTAYIVMEYVEGDTLKSHLKSCGGRISVDETFYMMRPVIQSLAKVHEAEIIHRDISPDNIMIQEGGNIKLIDFGAARDFGQDGEKSLSVLLKPGFAPEEQYRSRGNQGPWTDVYALCATIYRCITGEKPPESMERMRQDTIKKPSELGVTISPSQEAAIMSGLEVFAEKRIQTMGELEQKLYGSAQPMSSGNTSYIPEQDIPQKQKKEISPKPEQAAGLLKPSVSVKIIAISATVLAAVIILLLIIGNGAGKKAELTEDEANKMEAEAVSEESSAESDAISQQEIIEAAVQAEIQKQEEEAKKKSQETEKAVTSAASAASESTVDVAESVYDEFGIDKNMSEDYWNNLDPKEYLRYDSGKEMFYFWYPSKLYNEVEVDDEPEKSDFGTNIKTITFSGRDGGMLEYAMYKRTDNRSIAGFTEFVHNDELYSMHAFNDIIFRAEDGRIVATGYTDATQQYDVYDLIKIDDQYMYKMTVIKRAFSNEEDRLVKSYVTDVLYRSCGFSGSTKAPRSYQEFLESNS